jgi:adenylate cyclase
MVDPEEGPRISGLDSVREAAQRDAHSAASIAGEDGAFVPVVLLVDDEPRVLLSLRRLLRPTGRQVLTAHEPLHR